jgi:hypothetical protein
MSMNDEDTDKSANQSPVFYRGTGLVIALATLFFLIAALSSFFGVGMIVIGISAGFQGRDTLICNRIELSKIDCQMIRSSFLGKQSETIQDVQKAEIRITKVRAGTKIKTYNYNYQILLIAKSGLYPLFYPETSFEEQNTTLFKSEVSYINDFINNPGKNSIKMEEKEYALSYIIRGIYLIIIGWVPWIMLSIFCHLLDAAIRAKRQKAPR